MSFLGLEDYHAFVTGARGGLGLAIVRELRAAGCKVTAHDQKHPTGPADPDVLQLQGDISDEASISASFADALAHFGAINILVANAGIINQVSNPSIWDLDLEIWEKTHRVNSRGTFLTVKHFLRAARDVQEAGGFQLANLAVVVTGSDCGKFGQFGHVDYASGKAGLQYGLVPSVKNEIVRLNSKARVNAVAPGWINTPLVGGRLDDPRELYMESQGTVALKKIAQPEDVARTVAYLSSHRVAGHITGQCLSVDGEWKEESSGEKRRCWGRFDLIHQHNP